MQFTLGVLATAILFITGYYVTSVIEVSKDRAADLVILSSIAVATVIAGLCLVVAFRRRIFGLLFGTTQSRLVEVFDSAANAGEAIVEGRSADAVSAISDTGRRVVAWYSWSNFYRWAIGTAAAILVGFVGALSVLLLIEQNKKLETQNALVTQQSNLIEAQRRASLISELTSILDQLKAERDDWHRGLPKEKRIGVVQDNPNRSDLRPTRYDGAVKKGTSARGFVPSRSVSGRFAALSRSFKPYFYLDVQPSADSHPNMADLTERPLSPERAQMLIAVINSEVPSYVFDQAGAIYDYADLFQANLQDLMLTRKSLRFANLSEANLEYANFGGSNLEGTDFSRANLHGADFYGSILPSPWNFEDAVLGEYSLYGAKVSNPRWHEDACQVKGWIRMHICGGKWKLVQPGESFPWDREDSDSGPVTNMVEPDGTQWWILVPVDTPVKQLIHQGTQ